MSRIKLKYLILYLGVVILFYGCKSDDDTSGESESQTYWLKRYSPNVITGEDSIIYDEQNIQWTFDFQNNTLKVEILNDAESVLLEPGTYSNVINQESSCDNGSRQLIFNNIYYGHIFFNNNNQPPALILEDLCFTARSLLFEEI